MANTLIQLPPIIVRSSHINTVEDAITNLFNVKCIKKCSFEEQNIALISFLPMPSYICLDFYKLLQSPVNIQYQGNEFIIESQYYTNI